jgi:hypothetical protein
MHPSLTELLAFRDGEAAQGVADHLRSCERCTNELERLRLLTAKLKALPECKPPRDLWPGVLKASRHHRRAKRIRLAWAAAAACVLMASAALLLRQSGGGAPSPMGAGPAASASPQASAARPSGPAAEPPGKGAAAAPSTPDPGKASVAASPAPNDQVELARLIRQSQRLESVLRRVEASSRVQSGWQAAAVTDLQDHLASVDGRIVAVGQEGKAQQMVGLWRKRVDLLSTLLRVQTESQGQVCL